MPLADAPFPVPVIAGLLIAGLSLFIVVLYRRLGKMRATLDAAIGQGDRTRALAQQESARREGAEQALSLSEGRMKAVLDAAVDGIITIDEEARIASFNPAAETIFGYRAAEVLGANVNILMPEPYHHAHDQYLANYQKSGQARIIGIGREVVGRRKDGSTFPMDLAVGESRLAGRRIFAGIVRDVTQRKLTEMQLIESEERFRLLVGGVKDYAINLMDEQGRVTNWNQGSERMYGWHQDEVLGRDYAFFFSPEEMTRQEPARVLSLAQADGAVGREVRQRRKDGSVFPAQVDITPLLDPRGRPRGYVRIARDLTEQKTQEALLRTAKEEAERANIAKSKFLAAASHDLRQPVQALVFFTSALAMKLGDTAAGTMLGDVQGSLDGLNSLLDALLDVSKLDAGVVTPAIEDFPLSALLSRVGAEFAPQAQEKGAALRVAATSAFVRSDPTLLGRMISNLVANAVRYTPGGKIVLGARMAGKGRIRIEIWDNGIGIPANRQEEVFHEFTQIGNPERDRNKGLGLGLAIVRRLSRLLGHPVTLRSTPGRGSVFAIEVERIPARKIITPSLVTQTESERRLVVVIDDEAAVLKGLGMLLETWGYEVVAAASETEAIQLLENQQRQPHVILADYRLREGRNGAEAVRSIRALFNAAIPSIIITGDTAPERLREAEASGFSILHKPVRPPHLHTLLNQSISATRH